MTQTRPTITAYVACGEARPAFQEALADQMAGFTGSPPPQIIAWLERMKAAQAQMQGEKA